MDFRRLDLNLLAVFDALYEEGNVTAAARRLRVSQPTVSFALGKLRHFFDDPLFLRAKGGMKPTPTAQRLSLPIRDAINIIKSRVVPSQNFDPLLTSRTFCISTSDIGELCFLPMLLDAFRTRAPAASLRSVSLPPDQLRIAMETGEVDLATGYFPDLAASPFRREELFSHPFTCLVRRGHPLCGDGLTLEAFLAAEHAVVIQKGRSQEIFERTMASLGFERRILLESPHFMSLPFLIAQSDLVAIVPRAVGTTFSELTGLTLIEPPVEIPPIALAQHWHSASDMDPSVTWLRSLVNELFLGRDPTI